MEKRYYIVQYTNPNGDGRPVSEGVMTQEYFDAWFKENNDYNISMGWTELDKWDYNLEPTDILG